MVLQEVEILDPLDRALTNVIRNLIKIDETSFTSNDDQRSDLSNFTEPGPSTRSPESVKSSKKKNFKRMAKDWTTQCSYEFEDDESKIFFPTDENLQENNQDVTTSKKEQGFVTSGQFESVFSIGPFPSGSSEDYKPTHLEAEDTLLTHFGGNCPSSVDDDVSSAKLNSGTKTVDEIRTVVDFQLKQNKDTGAASKVVDSLKQSNVTHQSSQNSEASSSQSLITSTNNNNSTNRSPDEILAARAARLKRLEEQADWLVKKMNATSQRGSALSNRLEELHETYGSPPGPPPLPDVLPTFKLQTEIESDSQNVRYN